MKRFQMIAFVAAVLVLASVGLLAGPSSAGTPDRKVANNPSANAPTSSKTILYWYDPMKPEQHFTKPGKSPMGMQLVPKYAPEKSAVERKVLYWYDPMKPETHFAKPGKSPFMDMQLLPKYAPGKTTPDPVPKEDRR
jgi:hypothetical protein